MYQLAHVTKITNTEHDAIFALDAPVDEGAEDGAGAAMVTDLGDRVALSSRIPRQAMAGYDLRAGH